MLNFVKDGFKAVFVFTSHRKLFTIDGILKCIHHAVAVFLVPFRPNFKQYNQLELRLFFFQTIRRNLTDNYPKRRSSNLAQLQQDVSVSEKKPSYPKFGIILFKYNIYDEIYYII